MINIARTFDGRPPARRAAPRSLCREPFRIAVLSLLAILATRSDSPAQEKSSIPAFDARRHVYVGEGVRGEYRSIEDQIRRLEKATPGYRYFVVLVRSAGPHTPTATRDYADELFAAWREQAAARRLPLDEAGSVIIVIAMDNKQVAVHPGTALSEMGLRGDRIEGELVKPSGFLDIVRSGRYPEAITALLNRTEEWVAIHDASIRRTASAEKSAAAVPTSPPVRSAGASQAQTGVVVASPAPADVMTGRNLAAGLGLSLLAIVAAVIGGFWMAHRRTRGRLDQRIKEIRSRATDVMDRLDTLKERLKLLPASDPDFKTPMAGETASLYASVQEAVGKLWDRWLQVMDSVDRAQKLALGVTSPFQRKALHDAEAVLEQKAAFEEIDAGAQACAADMDRLNQAHEAARSTLETVGSGKPGLDAQIEVIRKLGLPIGPYQDEMAAIAAEIDQAGALIPADPIGAREKLEALRGRGDALIARAERVGGLFQQAQKLSSALEMLKRQVTDHRTKGLRLDEAGGNPDESLADADRASAATASALGVGDADAAATELDTAQTMLERARTTVEQVRTAREYCRREQPERIRATDRLRSALPQAEADYQRLEHEFAPASWEGVSQSLDRIHGLLASFDRLAADAAVESSDDAQRYLAGAGLLRQLAQQQQAALRLMSGIGDNLNALSAVRDECRRLRGELDAAIRRVEDDFRRNDRKVSAMALDILDQARRAREVVLDAFEQPRPDWPSLRDGLAKAMESISVARDQAEVDVRSYEQLAAEYERARVELERVAGLLAGRREDRKAANQRFRSAAEVLDQVGLDLEQSHGEWPRMLDQVKGAVGDLEQAERLAREDIRLAAQAQAEIEEAARSIGQARGDFGMGVGADTSAAQAAVDRAEQLLGSQHYEQAIESAGQAQLAARRAHQDAVQQASWRQMQADAERRRWEGGRGGSALGDALTTGAAVAAGVILGNLVSGSVEAGTSPSPDIPEPAISPEPPPTDTSVTSWESDTGQSSW
jgi:septation ring formation regulator EzrA